jgi:hypothetical protein
MSPSSYRRLFAAREIIVVDLADAALAALVIALQVEHPTLAELAPHGGPPTLRLARDLVRLARRLRLALRRYRDAVDEALGDMPQPDDDMPF